MGRCSEVFGSPSFPPALLIFLTGLSQMGTIKSIGIYVEDITTELGTSSTDIGIAMGLFAAVSYMPAPLVAAMYRQRPFRRIMLICCAFLTPLGILMTSEAIHKIWLPIFLSISGFGNCVLLTSASIALNDFGSPHFKLIWSFANNGYGVGMVVLPFLAEFLRQLYGWRGGLLLLGGLIANIIPCAVAVKVQTTSAEQRTDMQSSNDGELSEAPSCSMPKDIGAKPNILLESTQREVKTEDTDSENDLGCTKQRETEPLVNSHPGLGDAEVKEQNDEPSSSFPCKLLADFRQSDFYVDPVYNLLFLSVFLNATVYCGWHAFLVPHALQRGLSIQNVVTLTLFAATGSISGRFLIGFLCNNRFNPISVYLIFTVLNIASLLSDVYIPNLYIMMLTTFISASAAAGRSVLGTLASRERASARKKDVAFACSFLCFGIGQLLGGYFSGIVTFALDTIGRKLFWLDDELKVIMTSYLNGSEPEIMIDQMKQPTYMATDIWNRWLYWDARRVIYRANLDGKGGNEMVSEIDVILCSCIDYKGLNLYWVVKHGNRLRSMSLSQIGSGIKDYYRLPVSNPVGLALHEGHFYMMYRSGFKLYHFNSPADYTEFNVIASSLDGAVTPQTMKRASGLFVRRF